MVQVGRLGGSLEDSLHDFSSFSSLPVLLLLGGVSKCACVYERLSDCENREIDRERVSK